MYSKVHQRTGEVSRGRFGLAITSLGDINYDGFVGRSNTMLLCQRTVYNFVGSSSMKRKRFRSFMAYGYKYIDKYWLTEL